MKENKPLIYRKSKGQIVVEGSVMLTNENGEKYNMVKDLLYADVQNRKTSPFVMDHININLTIIYL